MSHSARFHFAAVIYDSFDDVTMQQQKRVNITNTGSQRRNSECQQSWSMAAAVLCQVLLGLWPDLILNALMGVQGTEQPDNTVSLRYNIARSKDYRLNPAARWPGR